MVDPGLALIVFAGIVLVVAALAWPRRGLVARLREFLRLTQRVRMEDAVKHLHEHDYRGQRGSVDNIAGALEITRARAVRLVAELEAAGLVRSEGQDLSLTDQGRSEALRLLRSHRLWERYLADRTGVAPADWHEEAERREHTLSEGRVEQLSASMGHPVYDPHGDPIPTASGKLPPHTGVSVAGLEPGRVGTIVHLEDEPREVYEQLIAAGLAVGSKVQLLDVAPERIRIAVDGMEHVLAPVVAANITVSPHRVDEGVLEGPFESLASLSPGEEAVVTEISPACPPPQRRRLLDLGLVPNTVVRAELKGTASGPVAYRVREALIALRREQAELVRI
ncbi:MAG: iron dependent repressor, metal binding and dimerization domain protein, partial [Gemmatimonadales bacterium]